MRSRWSALFLLAALVLTGLPSYADWYNPASWFRKKDKTHETLIVTGNYVKSRLLAELVQHHTGYPVLLLPTGLEKDTMYLLGPQGKALEIKREDFLFYVDYLHPKTVVFLGNDQYAPAQYAAQIKERFAIAQFDANEWDKISVSVGELFNLPTLAEEYKTMLDKVEGEDLAGRDMDALFKQGATPETLKEKPLVETRQQP